MRALDIQYMWQCLPEIMKGMQHLNQKLFPDHGGEENHV